MFRLTYLVFLAMVGYSVGHYLEPRNTVRNDYKRGGDNVAANEAHTKYCQISKEISSKNCGYGTHMNIVCGYRDDCLQGPGEKCSETLRELDYFGLKCAEGYICKFGTCIGSPFEFDSNVINIAKVLPWPILKRHDYDYM